MKWVSPRAQFLCDARKLDTLMHGDSSFTASAISRKVIHGFHQPETIHRQIRFRPYGPGTPCVSTLKRHFSAALASHNPRDHAQFRYMKNKNIAVIGAGFAGLSSALLLARAGHRVSLFEKFGEPAAVGAGILLQPTGLAAIRTLGIEAAILGAGARVDWLWGGTPKGRAVIDIHYEDWRAGAFGLGLHRGVLFNALWTRVQAAGVNLFTGHEVHDLKALASTHDLVVIADC